MIAGSVIVAAVLTGLTPYFVENSLIDSDIRNFNASANVTEKTNQSSAGILTEQSLEFGRMTAGTGVAKFFNFSAQEEILVEFSANGNISEKLTTPGAVYFTDDRQLEVKFQSEEPGYYDGELVLKISSSDSRIGRFWLETKSEIRQTVKAATSIF